MFSAVRSTALRRTLLTPTATLTSIRSKHTLPDLPYAYDALEPHISEEIMTLHHTKHHQTYVNGLNAAEEQYAALGDSLADNQKKISLQSAPKFNGGGHINHSLFWANLASSSSGGGSLFKAPSLKAAIEKTFGSVPAFKKEMSAKTAAVQGSGWGWLGYNATSGALEIVTTPNQDPLLSHTPIIGIDVWEHAFYLQYKNVKPDYLEAIWNVINFEEGERRYNAAKK